MKDDNIKFSEAVRYWFKTRFHQLREPTGQIAMMHITDRIVTIKSEQEAGDRFGDILRIYFEYGKSTITLKRFKGWMKKCHGGEGNYEMDHARKGQGGPSCLSMVD